MRGAATGCRGEGEEGSDVDGPTELLPKLEVMGQVVPQLRFLCVEEEDWFLRLHVTLAGEMSGVVGALNQCFGADRVGPQVRALQQLEKAIEVLVRVHYTAGIGQPIGADVPQVRPALLMQRMHRFLPHVKELGLSPHILRATRVYCATGIDQPCLLHLFGVEKDDNALGASAAIEPEGRVSWNRTGGARQLEPSPRAASAGTERGPLGRGAALSSPVLSRLVFLPWASSTMGRALPRVAARHGI